MGQEQNFGLGVKFWVGSEILDQEQNFGLRVRFWAMSKISDHEQNFQLGKFFLSGSENLGWGLNFGL